jgi:hypothetical protein
MHEAATVALIAKKWSELVESCCPGVTHAEWHIGRREVVIAAWFAPRNTHNGSGSPQMTAIVVDSPTVDDYMRASPVAQFRANGHLIDFVTSKHLESSPRREPKDGGVPRVEQWAVSSAILGLDEKSSA